MFFELVLMCQAEKEVSNYFFLNVYLFIWLCQVLVAACRTFSCGMRTLSCSTQDLDPWAGVCSVTLNPTDFATTGLQQPHGL